MQTSSQRKLASLSIVLTMVTAPLYVFNNANIISLDISFI